MTFKPDNSKSQNQEIMKKYRTKIHDIYKLHTPTPLDRISQSLEFVKKRETKYTSVTLHTLKEEWQNLLPTGH